MRCLLLAFVVWLAGSSSAAAGYAEDDKACFSKTSTPDEGIGACSRVIKAGRLKGTDLATAHVWRGGFHARKKEWAEAIVDFSEAIRRHPTGASPYNQRGAAYLEQLAFDQAIADFDRAIRLNPKSAANYNNRGYAYIRKGDLARALADLDQALAIDPKHLPALNNRGLAYWRKGLHDIAMLDYDAAIRIDPKNYEAYINRGIAYRENGELDRAVVDFETAATIEPRRAGIPFHRGFIARLKGDLRGAMAEFDKAAALGGNSPDLFAYRGLTHEGLGDLERARADYQTAIAAPPVAVLSPLSQHMARVRLALLSGGGDLGTASPAREADAAAGRRVALVIGNAAYVGTAGLANPVNDARAVGAVLRGAGFEVSEGLDLDRDRMQRLIAGFLREAANARVVVIFYAGHGMQIDGRNYLVPVDARLKRGSNPAADMTIVDTMLAGLEDQRRTTIVILDACRDNPLAARVADAVPSRSMASPGLAVPGTLGGGATLGAGTLIAFATAPGRVALDGRGQNSPFTTALVRHLGTPGLELQQMLTRVRAEVVAATGNKQVPWSNSSLLGEVYLVK